MRRGQVTDPEFPMLALRTFGDSHLPADSLTVLCWCERRILVVPRAVVLASRTGSCGRRDCREP